MIALGDPIMASGTTNNYRYSLHSAAGARRVHGRVRRQFVCRRRRHFNLLERETFTVANATSAVVDPTPLSKIDRELLNNDRSYIDVAFTPVSGSWAKVVDANNVDLRIAAIISIIDAAAEFTIVGADAQNANFTGSPAGVIIPKVGNQIVVSRNSGESDAAFAARILSALDGAGAGAELRFRYGYTNTAQLRPRHGHVHGRGVD